MLGRIISPRADIPMTGASGMRRLTALASTDTPTKADHPIKVAAIAGSLRQASFNRGLIRCAIEIARESMPYMQISLVEIGNLPFVNTDLEVDNRFPEAVEEFRAKVLQADSILFASPEYNYSVTGILKNAVDWASRHPNVWADKPAAVMSAGGGFGGGRSQYHLRQIGVFLDLHFINKPELYVNAFQAPSKFDSEGNVIDNEIRERVKGLLLSLHAFTVRLQNREVLG